MRRWVINQPCTVSNRHRDALVLRLDIARHVASAPCHNTRRCHHPLLEQRAGALLASSPVEAARFCVATSSLSRFRFPLLGAVAYQSDRRVQGAWQPGNDRLIGSGTGLGLSSPSDPDHDQAAPRECRDENRHPLPQQQAVFDPPPDRGRPHTRAHRAHPRPAALLHAHCRRWFQPALQGQADHRVRCGDPAYWRIGHPVRHRGAAPV